MTLLIDNYDSFTYNLYQMICALGYDSEVRRNDQISLDEIRALNPKHIVLSPGPGAPPQAGVTLDVVREFSGKIPILGVCLGHQAIGQAFGGKVVRAPRPVHGKLARVRHDGKGLFRGLKGPFTAARYHSLVVERRSLPDCLEITARTSDGLIMGLRHKKLAVEGVQFHPESIATTEGKRMLGNFLGQKGRVRG